MNVPVHLQLRARAKASAALCAAMGLFAISAQFAPAVAADEPQATPGTQVGPLPTVPPHVHAEAITLGERLAAEPASEGLLAGVNPHVQDQVGPPLELLAALQALKVLLLAVRACAIFKVFAGGEAFATFHTQIRPLASVHPLVKDAGRVLGEGFAAEFAAERLFARVDPDVQDKPVSLLKLLVALHALEGLLSPVILLHVPDEDGVLSEKFPTEATALLFSGRLLHVHVDFNAVILVLRGVVFFVPAPV